VRGFFCCPVGHVNTFPILKLPPLGEEHPARPPDQTPYSQNGGTLGGTLQADSLIEFTELLRNEYGFLATEVPRILQAAEQAGLIRQES